MSEDFLDDLVLTTVGIDIGSATCQCILSRLTLRRRGRELSSRYAVVAREVIHRSAVRFTRYSAGDLLDEPALRRLWEDSLAESGLSTSDIDIGAVILTGEAARRANAHAVAELFAAQAGRFVCATAGHHMEAVLAAHGSGAVEQSRVDGCRVLNIDVGGGTTKFAAVDRGVVTATAAVHAGGRLMATDGGRITRLEPAGRALAARAGVGWSLGGVPDPADVARVADAMADAVVAAATGRAPDAELLTGPLPPGRYDAVRFSGGVAEYVYGREHRDLGDLGRALGAALRERRHLLPGPLAPGGDGIRATVLGAAQHTVQVSGSTVFVSHPAVLPLRELPVLRLMLDLSGDVDAATVAAAVRARLESAEPDVADRAAIAVRWDGPPSHARLRSLVDGLGTAVRRFRAPDALLCLLCDGDVGRTLGVLLREEFGWAGPVVSIDGIDVTDFDLVDVGAPLGTTNAVPVTIKSLLFFDSPEF